MRLAILHPINDTRITFFKKLIGVTTCNIVGRRIGDIPMDLGNKYKTIV